MTFSEKQLEDILFEKLINYQFDLLCDKGFHIYGPEDVLNEMKFDRQVDLNPYGIADIIITTFHDGFYDGVKYCDGFINFNIIELKAVKIKSKHINQVLRYKKAIQRYFDKCGNETTPHINISCFLIGAGINCGHYILNEIDSISLYTYDFNPIDGITFEYRNNDWIKDEGNEFVYRLDENLRFTDSFDYFKSSVKMLTDGGRFENA